MNTENNPPEDVTEVAPIGPGSMLRSAREAQGLSVEDIAARLNLRAHNINDIENEAFDASVSTTFIKGYLKAYARILGITEEQILNAYYRLGIAEPKYAQMHSFSQRTQQEAHNNRLTWFSYAIGAGLVGMLVWWWMQKANLEPATSEQLVSESIAASGEPELEPGQLQIAPLAGNQPVDELDASAAQGTQDDTENDNAASSAVQTEPVEAVVAAPEPVSKIDLAQFEVELKFSNDCWIKVTDANDKTLAIGVKDKGSTLALIGQGPFKLTVGAPKAVEISYNNRTFNMSQFKAGSIARFELPAKE